MRKPLMIDAKWNRRHGACYTDARLAALYDRPMTPLEVMTRKDGGWIYVTDADRAWVGYQAGVMTRPHLRECLARMLERLKKSGLLADPRLLAVIPSLRSGRIKAKVIDDAWPAYTAARAAARSTAWAADAARCAALVVSTDMLGWAASAAYDAASAYISANGGKVERKHQVTDIIEMLLEENHE